MGQKLRRQGMWPPLGFRIWFAFCGGLALAIIAATILVVVKISTDPESLGRFIGSVACGIEAPSPSRDGGVR